MTTKLSSVLPTIILKWIKREQQGEDSAKEQVELPVYLNQARKNLLCSVKVPTYGVPAHAWY